MRRTEILAAAAAAAQRFRRMFGAAESDGTETNLEGPSEGKLYPQQKGLDDSTALLFALELLRMSEASANDINAVFQNTLTRYSSKRKETETDLFWLGLHLLDREISAIYVQGKRDLFMDFLLNHLGHITTCEVSGAEAREIKEGLAARASATRDDYFRFQRVYPDENKPVVRTLLWEFTKSVAINYRGDYRDRTTLDVFGIVLTYSEVVHCLLAETN
jgi:hypothetical protein